MPKVQDLELAIRQRGYDAGMKYVLSQVIEEQRTIQQVVVRLVGLVDGLINSLNQVVQGTEGIKRELDRSNRAADVIKKDLN